MTKDKLSVYELTGKLTANPGGLPTCRAPSVLHVMYMLSVRSRVDRC